MKIIKTKKFSKWAERSKIDDDALVEAAKEIRTNIYEANYGGGVVKKRIANRGRGKSSSARTIVAFKKGNHCYFVYGFEKNEKDNITVNEEKALKLVAKALLSYTDIELNHYIKEGSLIEVEYE
jgi:hypothetical protein